MHIDPNAQTSHDPSSSLQYLTGEQADATATNTSGKTLGMLNVVVLHWEDSASLGRCLGHLSASNYPRLRVLVVENGSSNPEREAAARMVALHQLRLKQLMLLQLEKNLGYAGGNNAAIAYLNQAQMDGEVCILNPDVCVERETLSAMIAALSPGVGLVMCRAVSKTGTVLYDSIALSGFRQKNLISDQALVPTDYAQGACFIIRRSLVAACIFDERFFLYWEEVDLALRVRAAGYHILSVTTTRIVRDANSPLRLANALYYSARNGLLMKEKHPELMTMVGYIGYLGSLLLISLKLLSKPPCFISALRSLVQGVSDGRAGQYGMRKTCLSPTQVLKDGALPPAPLFRRKETLNEAKH